MCLCCLCKYASTPTHRTKHLYPPCSPVHFTHHVVDLCTPIHPHFTHQYLQSIHTMFLYLYNNQLLFAPVCCTLAQTQDTHTNITCCLDTRLYIWLTQHHNNSYMHIYKIHRHTHTVTDFTDAYISLSTRTFQTKS